MNLLPVFNGYGLGFILGAVLIIWLIYIGTKLGHEKNPPEKLYQRTEFVFIIVILVAMVILFFVQRAGYK